MATRWIIAPLLLALSAASSAATFTAVYQLLPQNPFSSHTPPRITSDYRWPGACLSCSTISLRLDDAPRVVRARVVLFWVPKSKANSIRIVLVRSGPSLTRNVGHFYSTGESTPRSASVDITAALNEAIEQGGTWHIGWQIRGNATDPPAVFGVKAEIDWEIWGLK